MKIKASIVAAMVASATLAQADGIVTDLCGAGHINEVQVQSDVQANPDGYFIRNLGVQISHGDPRLVRAVGKEFHLCTRSAATPNMDANVAQLVINERAVKYLFVPTCPTLTRPST